MSDDTTGPQASGSPWLVIWAESRAEKQVEKRIGALGLPSWLPTVKKRHRWSDRWKEVELPLFPGYLFAQAGTADLSRILRVPGVLTVISENGRPALLAHSFVESLRDAASRHGVDPEPVEEPVVYEPGDEVIVQEGALHGVRGVVRELKSRRQLVLWVSEIGRGVAFTIGSARVKPARG